MKLLKLTILVIFILKFSISSLLAVEKFNILATNKYVAAIVKSLVKDLATVESLEVSINSCSHAYQFTIKDIVKARSADLLVYIDESFENYIDKLLSVTNVRSVKLSTIDGIKLLSNRSAINWYIWYNINNMKILINYLSKILQQYLINYKEQIYQNCEILNLQLLNIERECNRLFRTLPDNIVVIDNAMEYFFDSSSTRIINISVDCHDHMNFSILQHINELSQKQDLLHVIVGNKVDISKWKIMLNNKVRVTQVQSYNLQNYKENEENSELIISMFSMIINQLYSILQ